jgi:hypothetical protein
VREPIRIVIHLGSGEEGENRRRELERIAADCQAVSQRGEASIGTLLQMIADGNLIIKQRPGESDGKGNNTQ